MFDFHFIYSENDFYDVLNVDKVFIRTSEKLSEISKKDISEANIPLQTLYLHNEIGKYIISMNGIRSIEIMNRN